MLGKEKRGGEGKGNGKGNGRKKRGKEIEGMEGKREELKWRKQRV